MRFIGSKDSLLYHIDKIISKNVDDNSETFLDLFSGTNVVGEYFKDKYTIYSNDLLFFSYVNAKAIIENNYELNFEGLKSLGINSPLDYLQKNANDYSLGKEVGYYEMNYSPTGNTMYLTSSNAKRVDFIREKIDQWHKMSLLNELEYYYLISVLVAAIPGVSNTTGTYGAFLKHWDPRALKQLELIPLTVKNNFKKNKSYNMDANHLIRTIQPDIVYIDTPYNNRQYAANYHLLENIAINSKPKLKGITRLFDWSKLKSDYSMKTKAYEAMKDLLMSINSTHVILSYNNEGIINEKQLIELAKKNSIDGEVDIMRIPYRKYKSKIPADSYDLYEILLYFKKNEPQKNTTKMFSPIRRTTLNTSVWQCKKNRFIKSPLNYIGGKYRLLNQIIPLFPNNINTFVDLFSGGANVGINVNANRYHFNDMNTRVNEMFRFFSNQNPDSLCKLIKERIRDHQLSKTNEEAFLKFRKLYNANPNPIDLYILSSFSYNYQVRFNNSMEFNNPFGRNRSHFSTNMEKNLINFINRLQSIDAIFTDKYFDDFDFNKLTSEDFVYLDPPYLITTGNYNDGNRGFRNWNHDEERKLYKILCSLSEKGIRYALSNVLSHKGKSNEILKDFIRHSNVHVTYLESDYNNSSHNSKKRGSTEVLITNYLPSTITK